MAVQLKLVRREDAAGTGSDVSDVSLLSNTDGFNLEYYDGWTQAVAQGMTPGNLSETFNLIAKGTSHDNLAANLQGLDDKLKEAEWYWDDPAERYGVWLRAQLTNETSARQALIRRGIGQPEDSLYGPYVDQEKTIRRYTLGLERLPWWENTALTTYPASGVQLSLGGASGSHGTVAGDVPARVAYMQLEQTNGTVDEVWLGFRTARFGTAANFEPQWATGSGSIYVNTGTTDEGTTMLCDFSAGDPDGDAMQSRFYVKVSDITANYSDQRGQFIVLLRAQLTAGSTTTRVRLLDGYASTEDELRRQDRVTIDSTDYHLYPLGTIQIPPLSGLISQNMLRSYRLVLQAERTAGAGSLRCDKFILIPIGEGALYASNVNMLSSLYMSRIRTTPQEDASGWTYSDAGGTNIVSSVSPRPQGPYGFTLPVGAGLTVLAGQGTGAHNESHHVLVTFKALCRWRTLRGSN